MNSPTAIIPICKTDGNPVDISTVITINGVTAVRDTQVNDGDVVKISRIRTLGDLLDAAGFTGIEDHDIE
jgi:hypothetical protein